MSAEARDATTREREAARAALTERDYRHYGPQPLHEGAELWQRRAGDAFLNIWEWDHSRYPGAHDRVAYEAETCFERGDGTWARVLLYSVPPSHLPERLPALESALLAARAALAPTPTEGEPDAE